MDWTSIALAALPVLASAGVTAAVAKVVAGRRGRARRVLGEEIAQYTGMPEELAAKDEYARYLVVAVREYSGEDPQELKARYQTQTVLALSAAGLAFGVFVLDGGAVLMYEELTFVENPGLYRVFVGAGGVSVAALYWLLWARYKGRQLFRSAELQKVRLAEVTDPRPRLSAVAVAAGLTNGELDGTPGIDSGAGLDGSASVD